MQFIKWLKSKKTEARKIDIEKIEISREDGTYFMLLNGHEIGRMIVSKEGSIEKRAANWIFPGLVKTGEKVGRINLIEIKDGFQGFGLGQLLYLHSFDNGGADWYYNSQTYPPATNTLKSLSKKGYIELHWWPKEPDWGNPGDKHLVRITEKGRQAYKEYEMVKTNRVT